MPAQNLHAYLEQLGRSHAFTWEELAANRALRIHPAQLARGRRSGIGAGVVLVVLALLALGGGLGGAALLYADLRPPISRVDMNGVVALAAAGIVVGAGLGIGAIATFVGVGRRRRVFERGQAFTVEGPIQKIHIRRGRGGDTYRYRIGAQTFDVSREAWHLVTHGARYRAYFVLEDLLSLEPL